jgi:hypothetical protein
MKLPPQVMTANTASHDGPTVAREPTILCLRASLVPDFVFVNLSERDGLVDGTMLIDIIACGAFCSADRKHLTKTLTCASTIDLQQASRSFDLGWIDLKFLFGR